MLYRTGISGIILKFHFDLTKVMVSLDLEGVDDDRQQYLWEKLVSLQSILQTEYLPDAFYHPDFPLESGKSIQRIYVQREGLSVHDKDSWQRAMLFLRDHMALLEEFILEYYEYLDS